MENKINYYSKSLQIIKDIGLLRRNSKLLLHVCCGPCACFPLIFLTPYFDVSIIFNNSNIYPKNEYLKRLAEVKKVIEYFEREKSIKIPLFVPPYDNQNYNKDLAPYASEKEGGKRCQICFYKRIEEGMKFASENNFDFFATALSVSPYKNAQVLNSIGKELEAKYPKVKFFYSDFKKKDGFLIGRRLANKLNLYEQDYCGCLYSYLDKLKRDEAKKENCEDEKKK